MFVCFSDEQKVWDILLYGAHSDPHIRGQTAVVIGHFLGHALREAGTWWTKWLSFKAPRGNKYFSECGMFICTTLIFNDHKFIELDLSLKPRSQEHICVCIHIFQY